MHNVCAKCRPLPTAAAAALAAAAAPGYDADDCSATPSLRPVRDIAHLPCVHLRPGVRVTTTTGDMLSRVFDEDEWAAAVPCTLDT